MSDTAEIFDFTKEKEARLVKCEPEPKSTFTDTPMWGHLCEGKRHDYVYVFKGMNCPFCEATEK